MKKVIRKLLNGIKILSAVIAFCIWCGAVEKMNFPIMIISWSYFLFFMYVNVNRPTSTSRKANKNVK